MCGSTKAALILLSKPQIKTAFFFHSSYRRLLWKKKDLLENRKVKSIRIKPDVKTWQKFSSQHSSFWCMLVFFLHFYSYASLSVIFRIHTEMETCSEKQLLKQDAGWNNMNWLVCWKSGMKKGGKKNPLVRALNTEVEKECCRKGRNCESFPSTRPTWNL